MIPVFVKTVFIPLMYLLTLVTLDFMLSFIVSW